MFCTHGSGVNTTERLVYPPGTFPAPTLTQVSASRNDSGQQTYFATQEKVQFWPFSGGPKMKKGDGDGTVNIRSLKVSLPVTVLPFSKLGECTGVLDAIQEAGRRVPGPPARLIPSVMHKMTNVLISS